MTQEERQLLLADLCARLPYKVMVECSIESGESIDLILSTSHIDELVNGSLIVKPYLRQMSNMTEEEKEAFQEYIFDSNEIGEIITLEASDWLNKKMFDYRGLIEKGLAIKITKENNPYANN